MTESQPTIMEWEHENGNSLSIIVHDGDLWFSQKTLSSFFRVTIPNINIHIADLKLVNYEVIEQEFQVVRTEGVRQVKRLVKHYPFEAAYSIGIRSRRFGEVSALQDLAVRCGITKGTHRIAPLKERAFGTLLVGALSGIAKILMQHHVPPYFIDFYLPEFALAIEYDEEHHKSQKQSVKDLEREKIISKQLAVQFIRVPAGKEIEGLNMILKFILKRIQNVS